MYLRYRQINEILIHCIIRIHLKCTCWHTGCKDTLRIDRYIKMSLTWISKLPQDIINYILPYTYTVQKATLLRDIRHYVSSKDQADTIYLQTWLRTTIDESPRHKEWIVNDIYVYICEESMIRDIDKYRELFMRAYGRKRIEAYVEWLDRQPFHRQMNILWGLLTEHERNCILKEHMFLQQLVFQP